MACRVSAGNFIHKTEKEISQANETDFFSSERDYKETELTSETKKMELFTKCRIRGLKNNMENEVNSHCAYNELTEDIFLNHTFDEDDFAIIQAFKEDTLPKKGLQQRKIMI
ncbi:hypothetical protein GLOIN_2v1788486 [Rhizophagus irregularis DAOM 181602=DAOM 197198]|uniref:Uncharacterized protein n=1 Tax=Rhizophagus irregularis (strain DAOM 181602 / DAOM 197198 / MUCL 43194) TaxID=747089 RepID=A0A2P4P3J7_RHIID|nr:hypothetical protein GLOIN_2v1788486 [Rhizophagus irregularis DAOM 181602=DAOM 197198]POG59969.1 hypothetical protein GLOIN_2v1788486 [Rhizophagus irregularis DAOM 181602=DAOM 197198]GBC28991.2 hypothetical protein GLOIN_2v1788486 [Rhizophagus irregularis DAOM 181602=DAOM 197198]|eukprot:XP_025166835.1 hypothetical protein GLOIN_2v1788486 [Rhizophagus irregularis DAOM 181602=DAOM 197198]